MVKFFQSIQVKISLFNKFLTFIFQNSLILDYIFLWRSKVNKKSFIGKWINNLSRNSSGLITYCFSKEEKNYRKYFWLSFNSIKNKYLIKTLILKNYSKFKLEGFHKIWKINYFN